MREILYVVANFAGVGLLSVIITINDIYKIKKNKKKKLLRMRKINIR